jgi:hypothetical protein
MEQVRHGSWRNEELVSSVGCLIVMFVKEGKKYIQDNLTCGFCSLTHCLVMQYKYKYKNDEAFLNPKTLLIHTAHSRF